jgi:hypothetical protein
MREIHHPGDPFPLLTISTTDGHSPVENSRPAGDRLAALPAHGEDVGDERVGVFRADGEAEDGVVVQGGDDVVYHLPGGGGGLAAAPGALDHLLGLAGAQVPAGARIDQIAAA